MISCCFGIIMIVDIPSVICKTEFEDSLCFSYILHVAVGLLAFYQIYTVRYFTFNTLVNLPFTLVYFQRFYFYDIWTSCTILATLFHASLLPLWIQFWISGHFCSNQVVPNVLVPPKSFKRWLFRYLTEVEVLAGHCILQAKLDQVKEEGWTSIENMPL